MTPEHQTTLEAINALILHKILTTIPVLATPDYITHNLIPRMESRRNRSASLSPTEVVNKLFNTYVIKPGEAMETLQEFTDSNFSLTPELASEIADIAYYTSQPNCPNWLKDPSPFYLSLHSTPDQAIIFCALKYETRLIFGNQPNYKDIEFEVLRRYLSTIS